MNPLVDLPFTEEELMSQLEDIDAVLLTHLHPDHWDKAAVKLLNKKIPLICPFSISSQIESFGFSNLKQISDFLSYKGIGIHLTSGQHGTGEIGEKMGEVNGFVLSHLNNNIYIAGDTIWCEEV